MVAIETQESTRRGALACVQFSFIMAASSVSPTFTISMGLEIFLVRIEINLLKVVQEIEDFEKLGCKIQCLIERMETIFSLSH